MVGMLVASTFVQAHHFWLPPPPEFADTTDGTGLFAPVHDWEPTQGEPEGLLDLLPPGSPAVSDINHDRLPDVFVPMPGYTDPELEDARDPGSALFLNDNSNQNAERFVDVTDVAGIDTDEHAYTASWGDINDDGWQDLVVAGYGFATLYRHNGNMTFTDATDEAGLPQDGLTLSAAWGDVDADGDLDLFLARYTPEDGEQPDGNLSTVPGMENALLLNEGGTFVEATETAGLGDLARRSTTASFIDVDRDGDLDLYVTNYEQADSLYLNDGTGSFTEQAANLGLADDGPSTCQAWGDLDRDGRLDLVVAHAGEPAGIYMNEATGFSDHTGEFNTSVTGEGTTWGCAAFDYDADADLDLFFTRSNLTGEQEHLPLLLTNQIESDVPLHFEDTTMEAGDGDRNPQGAEGTITEPRAHSGLAIAELNTDGQAAPDILTTTHHDDRVRLYRNVGWAGGWMGGNGEFLRLNLEGVQDNALGLGARVTIDAGDLHLVRQTGSSASWAGGAGDSGTLVYGLYKPYEADYHRSEDISITVEWPSGDLERYEDVWDVNSAVTITQDAGYSNDTMPPRAFLTLVDGEPGRAAWYTSESVTLELSAQDETRAGSLPTGVAEFAYSHDGQTWTSADPDEGVELTFTGEGMHTVWTRTVDEAGNEAVTLHPVRIDTQPPTGELADPASGSVYAQGEEIARAPADADPGRAVVLAPVDHLAPAPGPLGSDATQPVRTNASDDHGVRDVQYRLFRTDGRQVPAMWGNATRTPYLWQWPASQVAAGEYTLETTVEDLAGHETTIEPKVLVLPTTGTGLNRTLTQGPSPVQPS